MRFGHDDSSPKLASAPAPVRAERPALGTMVRMVAYAGHGRAETAVAKAFEAGFREIHRLEALLSSWKPSSDIGRVNDAEGRPVRISKETLDVVERGLWASRVSDGAFDLTFEVMSGLWRFGDAREKIPRVPSPEEVARHRQLVDYRKVEIDRENLTIRLQLGMRMSLGGIGKGYIVDRAARVLEAQGLDGFLIQAGGDLLGVGCKPGGEPWRSGVQDPRGPRGGYFATMEFSHHAFSTAGDYVHAYFVDGVRYHHIIDPRTGYPATACRSVTVWAADAVTADALDDAVFVLGPEKGLALIESIPGAGAVLVDAMGRIAVSRRLLGRLSILRQPAEGP